MSDEQHAESTDAPAKTRSPVERLLVWGLILGMLGLLGFEARAQFSYKRSLANLSERMKASDESGEDITLATAEECLSGGPSIGELQKREKGRITGVVSVTWPSLFKHYEIRLITTSTKDDAYVISFETPEAPVPEQKKAEPLDPDLDPGLMTPGGSPDESEARQRRPALDDETTPQKTVEEKTSTAKKAETTPPAKAESKKDDD